MRGRTFTDCGLYNGYGIILVTSSFGRMQAGYYVYDGDDIISEALNTLQDARDFIDKRWEAVG